jgi:hypothetical protein
MARRLTSAPTSDVPSLERSQNAASVAAREIKTPARTKWPPRPRPTSPTAAGYSG